MSSRSRERRILPGFGLTLGITTAWIGLLVVLPFAALALRASTSSWSDLVSAVASPRALASYLRAKSLLEENFTRLTRAKDAARELGITSETLCRLFRHFSGTTPYQFLLRLRLNLAVDLLLGTDLLVKEVAARAGFEDPFHFSRVFRRVQGIPPADFQRLHKRVSAGAGAPLPALSGTAPPTAPLAP